MSNNLYSSNKNAVGHYEALLQNIGSFGPENYTLAVPGSKIMPPPHNFIKFWIDWDNFTQAELVPKYLKKYLIWVPST